ncbi:heme o synthase [Pedomonas mirosovicensis]|uniref:heme o synthase n=1 Tax=Pedomonas mirosovicensis TaxID=2908641 RepID=UPI002168A072|nr:heme o synthase [Pedomonas mirosovicensis]MCH8684357.1 heme o synthase [Pedomonas mirosovicensis]
MNKSVTSTTMTASAHGAEADWLGFAQSGQLATWRDYFELLKPRVVSLVVFTGICGLMIAPGSINPILAAIAILCIAVGAGAAGAFNMWYEADTDALMRRTANRPIPAGRIAKPEALAFAVTLAGASVVLMGLATNWVAAGLLLASILYYTHIYTVWLKRRTPQNIVIGGGAGAFPPVIGWAAVTGDVTLLPALLFAIIFLWTPPHFWALSLFVKGDYERAGIPMLPVVAGERATRLQIWLYTWALVAAAIAPWPLGLTGATYGLVSTALGVLFLVGAFRVWRGEDMKAPKHLFAYSVLYLFVLFGTLVADHYLGRSL